MRLRSPGAAFVRRRPVPLGGWGDSTDLLGDVGERRLPRREPGR